MLSVATLYTKDSAFDRGGKAFVRSKGSTLRACNALFVSIEKAFPVFALRVDTWRSEESSHLNGLLTGIGARYTGRGGL